MLAHCGQPFADTSLFAVNAVCRRMREHVTVALSGDGGDEAFSGYGIYWRLARIAGYQNVPPPLWYGAAALMVPLACARVVPAHWPARFGDLARADGTSVIQSLFTWFSEKQHRELCRATNLLPVRRLFERQWECHLPRSASRVEDLSALASEMNIRLLLANDFLFKVDAASMKESLEIRVPMLDEDLFAFGLSLPHRLKVRAQTCKLVLREIAKRKLPAEVAAKSKGGFGVPVDSWVDANFRRQLRDVLLGPRSRLPEFFHPEFYRPRIEAFCDNRPFFTLSRDVLYQFAIMLLSIQVTLEARRRRGAAAEQQSVRELAARA
jgi:asparagine synthase (glutamine-hydrolysing)